MKASEAKEITRSVIDKNFTENYDKVIEEIKGAVSCGKYETMICFDISNEVKNKLREDGYDVYETPDGRNGIDYRVSWFRS